MEPPRRHPWFSNAPGQFSYRGIPWPATGIPWPQVPFQRGPPPSSNAYFDGPNFNGPIGWTRNMQLVDGAVQNILDNLNPDQPRTTFSVLRAALASLGLPSLSALGLTANEIPSLNKFAAKEAKVTAQMECYIAARSIVTLHDLEREVLHMEGIKEYQDLALGPLLEHPVVKKNFPNVSTVIRVTTADILHHLNIHMNQNEAKQVDQTDFLRYLGDTKSQAPQHLGVLIKDMRMYVEAVNRAQQTEKDVVAKFSKQARVKASHSRKSTSKVISRVSDFLKKEDVSCDGAIKCNSVRGSPTSSAPRDNGSGKIKVISAELDDSNKRKRLTSQTVPASHSSCPYPSAAEEKSRLIKRRRMFCTGKSTAGDGLRLSDSELSIFARNLNEACKKDNVHDVLNALRLATDRPGSVHSFAKYPQIGLLNVAILVQKAGLLEDIVPGFTLQKKEKLKVERARHEKSLFKDGEPSSEVLLTTVLHDIQIFFSEKGLEEVTKGFNSEKNLPPPSWWTALLCIFDCLHRLKERLPEECTPKFSGKWFLKFLYDRWDLLPGKLTGALVGNIQVKPELEVNVPHQRLCAFLRQALFAAEDEKQFTMEVGDRIRRQFHGTFEDSEVPRLMTELQMGTANSLMVYAGAIFPRVQGVELPLEVQKQEVGCQKMETELDASVVGALKFLDGAPPLSDLAIWSQWNIIYRPSLGDLLDFLEIGPGQGKFHIFVALNGALLRINKAATLETFLASFMKGCSTDIAESFISLLAIYGGARHIPKVLWQSYATKGVHLLMEEKRCSTTLQSTGVNADEWVARAAGTCVLEALLKIPDELRVLAAEILLPALKGELGKELPSVLLQSCKTNEHRSALHGIGLCLGVVEWVNDFIMMHRSAPSHVAGGSEPVLESPQCSLSMGEVAPESHQAVVRSQSCLTELTTSGTFCLGETSNRKSTISSSALIEKCKAMIESIRREEFGLGQQLDASESSLLLKQHARMGRALKRLSQDLYSEDSHFVLELIQNADDNMYESGVQPTIIFVLEQEYITVFNNEIGFTEANIRALCDVGNSTKADRVGYIGQKGIGFKSVFRVTDAPEIHSNGFHFKFDVLDGDIGCIVPTCIEPRPIFSSAATEALLPDTAGGTRVHLPIKQTLQINKLFGDLDDVHPSLLLFLRKLCCIAVENRITGSTSILRRQNLGQNLVQVSNSNGSSMSWVVAREQLHAPVPRPGKGETELVLGFPVQETPSGEYKAVFGNQKVFSYLPLRSYGLKFLVQADFLLTASREDVDKDNAWNQWLLSWIPSLFITASSSFRRLSAERSPGLCITEYLRFVPSEGEAHGFFQPLPRLILSRLRASACLPVDGEAQYAIPSLLLSGWDDAVRAVVPGEMLRKHLGLQYLHRDVSMADSLASSLGVQLYGKVTLMSLIASISQAGGLDLLGPKWIRSWMVLLHNYIRQGPQGGLAQEWKELNGVPFLPLSDGSYTSFGRGHLWFTSRDDDEDMFRHLPLVLADLKIIHPSLLGAAKGRNEYETGRDELRQLLVTFGIHEISTHEVVKTHVLTTFMDSECLGKNPKLMVEYLSLAMFHLQSDCQQCKAENFEIRTHLTKCAVILTNNGLKRIGSDPIHFSQMMGNPVDVKGFLRGTEVAWNEVDSCYCNLTQVGLKSSSLIQWRTFFKELGISDFLQLERKDGDGGSKSPAWHCPELIAILCKLSPPSAERKITHSQKQLAALMSALDKHWHDSFSVCEQQFDTTFISQLRSLSCLTCSMTGDLQRPTLLYDRCKAVEEVLGAQAPYALPKITSTGLIEALGLRTKVSVDDAVSVLEQWHHLSPFVAGLSQMERFYTILWQAKGTEKEKVIGAMTSRPSIFLPLTMNSNVNQALPGNFHHPKDLVWDDPTGAVEALYKVRSSGGALYADIKISLKNIYPRLGGFFVEEVQVPQVLQFDGYLNVLMHISKSYSPYEMQKHVLEIFKALSQQVENGGLEPSMLEHWRSCLQNKRYSVFPTHQGNWVSLSSCEGFICLSDCATVRQEMTASLENVHFLLLGDDAPGKDLDQDDRVVKTDVLPLLRALDVPLLSEAVILDIVAEHERDGRQLQYILLWSLQYIQRYLAKHRPQEYRGLQSSSIHERIKCMQCVVVEQLSYRYVLLPANWSSQQKTASCLFQVQDSKLYVQAAYADDFCTIYKEMSRFFLSGQADLQLANFCQIVTSMQQSGASDVDIETFVSKVQGIPPLKHGDPLWSTSVECSMLRPKSGPGPGGDSHAEVKTEDAEECTLQGDGRIARHHDKRLRRQAPNEQQDVTGRAGEALVFRHLVQKHGADKVRWVNEAAESGAAFDILVELEDGSKEFVEVKSTRSADKDWFEISAREWEFAHQHGPSYTIMRVHLGQKPRLLHLRNPVKLCHSKALQIALIMQDSTGSPGD